MKLKPKSKSKKRLYAPPQDCLNIIKSELELQGLKSNNTTAVNQAVIFLKNAILSKRKLEKKAQENKNKLKQQISKL